MTPLAVLDWATITGSLALLNIALVVGVVVWVLAVKREPTSALAWCLLVIFVPILGSLFFILFGYQSIHVPLRRKRQHAEAFRTRPEAEGGGDGAGGYEGLAGLARGLGARPPVGGNA